MLRLDSSVGVLGTGSALPERRVTNAELEGLIANYDASSGDFSVWVDRVTHIQERRYADPETEDPGVLGLRAARQAIEAAGLEPKDIDHMLFCSFTKRELFPGDHTWIVNELGLDVGTCGIAAACAGSLWGMTLARSLVQSGQFDNVLVVASECITHVTDMRDPITAILFADAAGAVVIGRKPEDGRSGFLGNSVLRSDFNKTAISMWNANCPRRSQLLDDGVLHQERAFLQMAGGPRVLKHAVIRLTEVVVESLGFTMEQLKADDPELREVLDRAKVIPHQANGRILDGLQVKLGVPQENVYRTVYFAGNSSAATNLLTLDYAVREGNLRRVPPEEGSGRMGAIVACGAPIAEGDLVTVASIGAGYLYGAMSYIA
jgi:3-oxoacyl-[acyl-carrier-protein] synthase-3